MIKFFRTIRQRMLKENHFSRYFLYAIGEIVLVVIGILIALQINTWNEGRRSAEQETLYLHRLLAENRLDLETFAGSIKDLEKGNETIVAMSEAMTGASTPDSVLIRGASGFLGYGSIYPIFTSSRSTFEDLSSTGNLKVLRNTALRERIVKHYARHDQVEKRIRIAVDWALPLDAPFTVDNDVMKFEPHTAFLYPVEAGTILAQELRNRRMSYITNGAAHWWINSDAIDQLNVLMDETAALVRDLEHELELRAK